MSDASGSDEEKSYEPSQRKLDQERAEGNVAKSTDVTVAATYLAFLVALVGAGGQMAAGVAGPLAALLGRADDFTDAILAPGGARLAGLLILETLGALSALILLPFGAALAALFAQGAFVAAPKKLAPKLSRISPISTAKQKFGPTGLVEFGKNVVKLCAVAAALYWILSADIDRLIGAVRAEPRILAALLGDIFLRLLMAVTVIAVIIAAIDAIWQRADHARKLRMSHRELKEESKEVDGDPHIKTRRRQRAEEIATNRMMADVPSADVVIVNPTHYAVALKWSRTRQSAPICVAKGTDEVAHRIRETAAEAGVPIHQDAPTARALHGLVRIGDEIPPEQYRAVAAAIRFADDMRRAARERDGG